MAKVTSKIINNTVEPVKSKIVETIKTEVETEKAGKVEVLKEETKIVKKKFEPTEGIPCKSITVGGLYMEGAKSHLLYEWSNAGDITYVEYQDLYAGLMSNSAYIKRPLFVIEDEDFVAQNPQLNKIYEKMYSFGELKDVLLNLSPTEMKSAIIQLPEGAKNSIKHTASQLVSSGLLDSVNKIKILDELFGTDLTLMAGL